MFVQPTTAGNLKTMELTTIYEKLTGIFRDVFDDDALVATPEMTADDVYEWNSLNHLRMVMTVQKEFGVKFSAAETGGMKNVGDLSSLIQAKLK